MSRYSYLTGNHPSFVQVKMDTFGSALAESTAAVKAYGRVGNVNRHNSAVTGTVATIGCNGVAFPTDITTDHERELIESHNDRVFAQLVEARERTGARLALTSEWV